MHMHSPLTYLKSEPIFAQRRRAARPRTRYTTEATACSSSRCQLSTHGAYSHTADMCASTDAGDGKGRVVQPGCITTTGKTRRRRAQVGQVATAAHKIWNTDEVNARRNLMYITDVLTCSLRRAPEDAADVPISKWCPRAPRMASVLCPRGSAEAQGPGVRIFLRYLAGEWGEERAASRRELTFVSHGVRRVVDAGCTTPAECCAALRSRAVAARADYEVSESRAFR